MTDPVKPPADDLVDVTTHWGVMPRWKARALCLGEIQAVINATARNDAATQRADAARAELKRRADAAHALRRAQYYRDLYERCDRLEAYADRLLAREKERQQARARADAALAAAEELYTFPPPNDDDQETPT
jgi:hypothetical protein